jgi:hypothetical protein
MQNWQVHVAQILLRQCSNTGTFLKELAVMLLDENVSLEGYIVCSVLSKSFDLTFLLQHA